MLGKLMNSYELFQKIEKRPEMYLGRCSIYDLKAFHDGYITAKQELRATFTEEDEDFTGFHDWLENRLNVKSNGSWEKMLVFRSKNERKALDLFFKLLDEYIKRDKDLGVEPRSM